VVDNLSDGVMLRLGMTNPPYMLKHIEEVAKVLNHPNVFEFIHIPVQSGSNDVLRKMVREYTVEDFETLVNGLKQRVPKLSVATDIICGFPYETDEDHQQTVDLVKRYCFPTLNISQFYPRPGTPAASMKRIPTKIVKSRSTQLSEIFRSYQTLDHFIGSVQQVWFSEHSDRSDHVVGHNKQYVKVLAEPREGLVGGDPVLVKIISATKWHIVGVVCE